MKPLCTILLLALLCGAANGAAEASEPGLPAEGAASDPKPACITPDCAPPPGAPGALAALTARAAGVKVEDGPALEGDALPDAASFSSSRPAGADEMIAASLEDESLIEPVVERTAQQEWLAHRRCQWMILTAAQHAAAGFDAWSTRRAVRAGAHELNPLLRPVADSHAVHAVIHATPLLTDFLGQKMATSDKRWLRRLWWVPQTVSTAVHVYGGINNLGTYRAMRRD